MRLHVGSTVLVAASLGLAFLPAPAKADFLTHGWRGLVRIDELTAHGRVIREMTGYYPTSMAMSPRGTVYFVGNDWPTEQNYLGAIDPLTWEVRGVPESPLLSGSIYYSTAVRGLAFSPEGTLFAIAGTADVARPIHTIDPQTGVATLVGSTGLKGVCALAFSPDGTLYGWDIGDVNLAGAVGLVTLDPLTGLATDVNPAVGDGNELIMSLGFGPDGTLYGAAESLFRVDMGTGELTLVGRLVIPPDEYFGAPSLVWIPEPSTPTALLSLAAAAVVVHLSRRRRKRAKAGAR
jgi:hypothetical protein